MVKMLRSVVTALQSMSECARVCDNSDCGELITFYGNQARPIVCARCGKDIKWESRPITVGAVLYVGLNTILIRITVRCIVRQCC